MMKEALKLDKSFNSEASITNLFFLSFQINSKSILINFSKFLCFTKAERVS